MRNIFTVFQREFATYFNSPIGYIYIIVFVLLNAVLFITPFFSDPQADMRQMFNVMPFMLCILIPLISMRLWAEDRKENTIEMLLTFPMQPYELVLGKYLASLAFFIITLAGTALIPVMIGYLGKPDWGIIFSSYLGTFLLGAFFLALGILLSSLVRDQIIAAVLSLAGCFALFLVGTDFIAAVLDDWLSGFGTIFKQLLGVTPHYESFTRGIVAVVDILYFLIWTGLFLFLNGLFLEGRSRTNAAPIFSGAIVVCFLIGMLFNYLIGDMALGRFDCTEGKIYTVSEASINILKRLQAPVTVSLYITNREQMPTRFKTLEQDVIDKLNEIKIASGGKLHYKTIHLEVQNLVREFAAQQSIDKEKDKEKAAKKSLEETLLNKGIKPFPAQSYKDDQYSTQLIYAGLGIAYKEKQEKIIPEIYPGNLPDLEYQIISRIYQLTREKKPVVVLVAPKDDITPEMMRILMQLRQQIPPPYDAYKPLEAILEKEEYEIKRLDLEKGSPLPDEYDGMLVINPKELNDRQKWEVARALYSGKNVLLAVQNYTFEYTPEWGGISISKQEEKPQVNDWLEKYGIQVDEDILMDVNNTSTISRSPLQFPTHIVVTSANMDPTISITSGLGQVLYMWGTALKFDYNKLDESKLKCTVLMKSSKKSWKVPNGIELRNEHFSAKGKILDQFPLMALIEGQFPDAYIGKERPKWPAKQDRYGRTPPEEKTEEAAPKPVEPKPAKLLVVGCAQLFRYRTTQSGRGEVMIQIDNPDNHYLVMKSIEFLVSDTELGKIPSRSSMSRRIELPDNRGLWKVLNYLGIPVLIFLIGVARSSFRRMRRNQYTLQMQGK